MHFFYWSCSLYLKKKKRRRKLNLLVIPNVFTALKTPRIQLNSCTFIAHIRSIHVIRINHCSPLPNKWILMSMLLLMNVLNEFIMTPSKSKISKVHPPQYYHTVQQTLVYLFSFGKADHHVTKYVDEKYDCLFQLLWNGYPLLW